MAHLNTSKLRNYHDCVDIFINMGIMTQMTHFFSQENNGLLVRSNCHSDLHPM